MLIESLMFLAAVACGAFGWRLYRRWEVTRRTRAEDERVFGRHDHARALEIAKIESEVSRWRGQW